MVQRFDGGIEVAVFLLQSRKFHGKFVVVLIGHRLDLQRLDRMAAPNAVGQVPIISWQKMVVPASDGIKGRAVGPLGTLIWPSLALSYRAVIIFREADQPAATRPPFVRND
jgi:hypothetical protein